MMAVIRKMILSATILAWSATVLFAQSDSRPELIYHPRGNFSKNVARPLRYWPVNGDFVITNGAEFFNRPLYCANSAFRIDGGDKPEFSLYLPGRGGNLRFGIKTSAGIKWLNDADKIVTRYRAGSMVYEIHDPLLGGGNLNLSVLPLGEIERIDCACRIARRRQRRRIDLGVWRRERREWLARRRYRLRKRTGLRIFPIAAGAMPRQCVFHLKRTRLFCKAKCDDRRNFSAGIKTANRRRD